MVIHFITTRSVQLEAVSRDQANTAVTFITMIILLILWATSTKVHALEDDRDQPAVLEASYIELDLRNSVRTYRGGVVFRQGSILLNCDELITDFNTDGELQGGVCTGTPGRFEQRSEGSDGHLIGQAITITLDQTGNLVTLEGQVIVTQGRNTITGEVLTYDMATDKITVNSGIQAMGQTSGRSDSIDSVLSESENPGKRTAISESSPRARILIQPPDG